MTLMEKAFRRITGKLLGLLLGKREFPPGGEAEDWPPEGSMHFERYARPIASTGLPPDAREYEFAANVGEDDPQVFALGQEMTARLCQGRRVLVTVSFDPQLPKHLRRKGLPPPGEQAVQFWNALLPDAPVALREGAAAVLTSGCPGELFSRFQEGPAVLSHFPEFYLFSSPPSSAGEGLSMVERGEYQANLYLRYGPNALNVVLDPAKADLSAVRQVVHDVCRAHQILLWEPPGPAGSSGRSG